MLSIFSYWLSLIVFLLTVLICLYLPGFWFLKKSQIKANEIEIISLSLCLGIIFFVLTAWLFGYLHLRGLFFPLIFLFSFLVLKSYGWQSLKVFNPKTWSIRHKRIFIFLLILGILTQLWINIFSGWQYADGIRFWSSHGHDAIWHGTLMKEISQNFPPKMRFLAGFPIQNYHYFVDILMGEFYRLFTFSPFDLYFRHFTFLFATLFLLNIYVFVNNWRGEKAGLWAMFITIFGGSFGYLVTLFRSHTLLGLRSEAVFWVSQGNTAIGNPPQIAAFILFLTFLNLFWHWYQKSNRGLFIILVILGGGLWGFKVYAGATILAGLFLLAVYELFFQRKIRVLKLFLPIFILALVIFLSTTTKGGSFLVFQPWWFIRTMVVAGDRLGWIDLELKRQFYQAQHNWRGFLRILQFESMALLIFIIGNLGTKFLGFGEVFRILASRRKPANFDLFLIFSLTVCFVFPNIFVQKGVAWNTVQFFHYFVLLMSFFMSVVLADMSSRKGFIKIVIFTLIILFSLPTVVADLIFFSPKNALAMVENDELKALQVLQERTKPDDIIVTYPFSPWAAEAFKSQPRPIFSWDSTGYVAYFSNRQTYITDEGQVEIMGYRQGKERRTELEKYLFYSGSGIKIPKSPQDARQFLSRHNLKYIYLVYSQEFAFNPQEAGLENIFENRVARIYQLVD